MINLITIRPYWIEQVWRFNSNKFLPIILEKHHKQRLNCIYVDHTVNPSKIRFHCDTCIYYSKLLSTGIQIPVLYSYNNRMPQCSLRNCAAANTRDLLHGNKYLRASSSGSGGGQGPPPRPVKNRPKKDGCRMRRLIFHVSWSPLSEVSGSATGIVDVNVYFRECNTFLV